MVKTVQVNGRENILQVRSDNVEFSDQLDFAPRPFSIDAEFARRNHKVFLEDLERNDARSIAPVLDEEFARAPLLDRIGIVINIDQDIGIEEATSAHEFRRG